MRYSELIESLTTIVLYHGTCPDNAQALITNGWKPNSGAIGANQGQNRFLYLTNHPENALWFAEQKGCSTVLEVTVSEGALRVDPEDGIADDVNTELNHAHGIPGSVVCFKPLGPECFSLYVPK